MFPLIFSCITMYNVLIAGDDVDAWFRVSSLLRRYLVKASFVTSFSAARQWIDRQTASVLFFDKQLQDQSSLDFVRYVRAKYPDIKIVMVDNYGTGSMGFRSRADLNICKPFVPEVIERAIVKLLFPQVHEFQHA
jgi:DNA-binding NtrC family response regulator